VGTNHQRLLDIGCFGRAGNEGSEGPLTDGAARFSSPFPGQLFICLVHVVDNLVRLDDQGEMLVDEVNDPVPDSVVRDPNRPVFRHAEMARQNGEIDAFELVRVFDGFQVDVARPCSRNQRNSLLRLLPGGDFRQMGVELRKVRNGQAFSANRLDDRSELGQRIGIRNPILLKRRQIGRRHLMAADCGKDGSFAHKEIVIARRQTRNEPHGGRRGSFWQLFWWL
jgi:hypothetical protein